jgi:hypothetical protein
MLVRCAYTYDNTVLRSTCTDGASLQERLLRLPCYSDCLPRDVAEGVRNTATLTGNMGPGRSGSGAADLRDDGIGSAHARHYSDSSSGKIGGGGGGGGGGGEGGGEGSFGSGVGSHRRSGTKQRSGARAAGLVHSDLDEERVLGQGGGGEEHGNEWSASADSSRNTSGINLAGLTLQPKSQSQSQSAGQQQRRFGSREEDNESWLHGKDGFRLGVFLFKNYR